MFFRSFTAAEIKWNYLLLRMLGELTDSKSRNND